MKFYIFLIFPFLATSQVIVVSTPLNNQLYAGIANAVDISIENTKCKDFFIEVEGEVFKSENCYFTIIPKKTGLLEIKIINSKKNKEKKIYLNVENINLSARIMAPVDKEDNLLLTRANGISVESKKVDLNFDNSKVEYDLIIVRKDTILINEHFKGKMFNEKVKFYFNNLQDEDIILFRNITININNKQYFVEPIVVEKKLKKN
ncbi:MAG: hypothetical protein MUF43_04685 [Flavobacterium sp.]|nr:hypothetical protein [Flavobacterium sp.]